jgi:hypothetical protein
MAFIPVPDTAQVNLVFGLSGETVENTLYFLKAGGWDAADLDALALAVANWWATYIAGNIHSSQHLQEVRAVDLQTDTGAGVSYVPPTPISGGAGGSVVANNVACCIGFRSASRGRSARGRNYVSGLTNGNVVASRIEPSVVASLVAGYNQLAGVAEATGSTWVIASRYHAKAPRVTGVTFPVTTAVAFDNVVDSQRRRLPGRGV